jgi:predicted acylesterase/phospholipase RssA
MTRELRLAFAMGGGVALGTFSGAALSEVLKLAILYGNNKGDRYNRVVVDVFSGASAGAMSLALMLRGLAHRSQAEENAATAALQAELGARFTELDPAHARAIVAAQVVQDLQARAWGEEISLDRLLGKAGARSRDLKYSASILDRGAVDDIAGQMLRVEDGADFKTRELLGDRVLFACSLANLTPIVYSAAGEFKTDIGLAALSDGLSSLGHRELRVFDLNFGEVTSNETDRRTRYPKRWCRYHMAPEDSGRVGQLNLAKTWEKISLTAIASGAFPIALEPVVLRRKSWEYGPSWPKALEGLDEYPFTFVDGGTFNNEPIREAFRMSAFMDAQRPGEFDRRVIFVDPSVSSVALSFQVPVHQEWELDPPNVLGTLDGWDLRRRTTLDRLRAHAVSLARAVYDEATVIEADKIYGVRDRLARRSELRDLLKPALHSAPSVELLQDLIDWSKDQLDRDMDRHDTPAHSLDIARAIARVLSEDEATRPYADHASDFVTAPGSVPEAERGLWLRALTYLAIDLLADLEGKAAESRLIAIGPLRDPTDPGTREELPGGRFFAFGGFMSSAPRRYEMAFARVCAERTLEAVGMIAIPDGVPRQKFPTFGATEQAAYARDIELGLGALGTRIAAMIRDGKLLNVLPGFDDAVRTAVASWAQSKIQRAQEASTLLRWQFRVRVPNKRFEFDGKGLGDADLGALRDPDSNQWTLITFADYDQKTGRWTGPHIEPDDRSLTIHLDGLGPLPDRKFCTIALPSKALVEKAELRPHAIFEATINASHEGKALLPESWALTGIG